MNHQSKMQAKSCYSLSTDPYRAGIEIGQALIDLQPEIVFLFSTIHYGGSPELVEAIFELLDPQQTLLIGNTGDGFYERQKVGVAGVSALGINTHGAVKWHMAYEEGVGKMPYETTKRCLEKLHADCQENPPTLYFLTSDFRTDTNKIISALQETALGPVVGGLAGDGYAFENCFVYANTQVLTDGIAVLAVEGEIPFQIHVAHELHPVGKPGEIAASQGTTIQIVDNIPAMDFIEQELGKPLDVIDQGIITFRITDRSNAKEGRILSLLLPEDRIKEKAVKLMGGVNQGNYAQVCLALPEKIIQDVRDIGVSLEKSPFKPMAAIIVSCAGRKKVLADNIAAELQEIIERCPSLMALAGFPSFGEFGPVKSSDGYSRSLFHNMTFILLLIGDQNL